MSELLAKSGVGKQPKKDHEVFGQKKFPQLDPRGRADLASLRKESRAAGATLATGGRGGLPPHVVLDAMRRDKFTCKRCGSQFMLGVHHRGDVTNLVHKALRKHAHDVDPAAIVTVCEARQGGGMGCHDAIHKEDRDVGEGKSHQVGHEPGETPDGDDASGS